MYAVVITITIGLVTAGPSIVFAGENTEKNLCKKNDGKWKDGSCDFDDDDKDKADQFTDDMGKIKKFEEDKADLADALCDDPKDSEKFEICQSEKLTDDDKDKDDKETKGSNDEEELKEVCDKYNDKAEWEDGECKWKLSEQESANWGFGDECEDNGFMERQPEFCNAD